MYEGLENQLVEQRVTYTLEITGKFYVVENVPARVDEETVERLQETILGQAEPNNVIETPVYEYSE